MELMLHAPGRVEANETAAPLSRPVSTVGLVIQARFVLVFLPP